MPVNTVGPEQKRASKADEGLFDNKGRTDDMFFLSGSGSQGEEANPTQTPTQAPGGEQ